MNRTRLFCVITLFFLVLPFHLAARGESGDGGGDTLNVYCYDSFSSEWGPGPAIAEAFLKTTGVRIEFNAPGDAVTVLNQLILEKNRPRADVVIGLDNSLLPRALEAGILEPYKSPGLDNVPERLLFDKTFSMLPFDYGHFAICYDSEVLTDPPTSLEDLTAVRFVDSLVLMDPRTSTPGLGFLLWTVAAYGDDWENYWRRLKPSILTVTDGWSQGYTLFTAGEAPMVLSYGTSPVYHAEYEGTDRFRAAEFSDGHVVQLEGMGIVAGTQNRSAAESFIDFMLSEEAQMSVAMGNIMLPVNSNLDLPESFSAAMQPDKILAISGGAPDSEDTEKLINRWTEVFSR
jgi:thiamine transport system substrate-binding protein